MKIIIINPIDLAPHQVSIYCQSLSPENDNLVLISIIMKFLNVQQIFCEKKRSSILPLVKFKLLFHKIFDISEYTRFSLQYLFWSEKQNMCQLRIVKYWREIFNVQ